MDLKCKRIIDGKTYNTETSTLVTGARQISDHEWFDIESGTFLYQSRFGQFFLYSYLSGAEEDDYQRITPQSPEEAQRWLEENHPYDTDLIEQYFGEMPEAGSAEVKYTLRLPESLHGRLSARAKENGQSLNAWIVRCLEGCAARVPEKKL